MGDEHTRMLTGAKRRASLGAAVLCPLRCRRAVSQLAVAQGGAFFVSVSADETAKVLAPPGV